MKTPVATPAFMPTREHLASARRTPTFQDVYAKQAPLVSVCVATCNRPKLLIERCIRSLRRQTYANLQIIVVGDHCTDATEYRLARLRDSRLHFENLPERGPYPRPGIHRWMVAGTMATNRALELSEGDFVAHLDDDDEAEPDRFATLVEHAQRTRAEFLWHKFQSEAANGVWVTLGIPRLKLGQITTGSIFYHRYLRSVPWDVFAYRAEEPGDWNRIHKISLLRPRLEYVDRVLTLHYREGQQGPFSAQRGERFLD